MYACSWGRSDVCSAGLVCYQTPLENTAFLYLSAYIHTSPSRFLASTTCSMNITIWASHVLGSTPNAAGYAPGKCALVKSAFSLRLADCPCLSKLRPNPASCLESIQCRWPVKQHLQAWQLAPRRCLCALQCSLHVLPEAM